MYPSRDPIDPKVRVMLKKASDESKGLGKAFQCQVFDEGSAWTSFVERWAPLVYDFIEHALGPFGTEPQRIILPMSDGEHTAGATASFNPGNGQVRLSPSVEFKAGQTLEKLTHELTHASLAKFPEGDPFYEEGFVDYSVWVMAHAPVWGPHREDMIEAAAFNIKMRRERAMLDLSDWDRKRWAGGLFASLSRGPFIIASLRHRKIENNFTW